jgi:hypothetical protein
MAAVVSPLLAAMPAALKTKGRAAAHNTAATSMSLFGEMENRSCVFILVLYIIVRRG